MDEGTGEIRQDIDESRSRPDSEKDAIESKRRGAMHPGPRVASTYGPSKQRLRSVKDTAERNPMGLVAGGVAVGFVAGLLLPSTHAEEEHHEALERGKDVAQTAMDTVKEEESEQQRHDLAAQLNQRVRPDTQNDEDIARQQAFS